MDHEWKIGKSSPTCCQCNEAFAIPDAGSDSSGNEGQQSDRSYFSALFTTSDGLIRKDFCAKCFSGNRPADVYYFWKTTISTGDTGARRPAPVDVEYVLEFFKRLEGDGAQQRIAFRYILALMLTRKKVLIAEGKSRDAQGAEVQVFREKRGGLTHRVLAPELQADEIAAVTGELGVLLGLKAPAAPAVPAGAVQTGDSNAVVSEAANAAADSGAETTRSAI